MLYYYKEFLIEKKEFKMKIKDAYLVSMDMHRLLDWFSNRRKAYLKHCVEFLASSIKGSTFEGDAADIETMQRLGEELKVLAAHKINHPLNFTSYAMVLPHWSAMYVQFFESSIPAFSMIEKEDISENGGIFKEFNYDSAKEKPEKISESEWEWRSKVWKEILERGDRTRDMGLQYLFFDTTDVMDIVEQAATMKRKRDNEVKCN